MIGRVGLGCRQSGTGNLLFFSVTNRTRNRYHNRGHQRFYFLNDATEIFGIFAAAKAAGNSKLIYAEILREISGFLPRILVPSGRYYLLMRHLIESLKNAQGINQIK